MNFKLSDLCIRDPFLFVENGTGYLIGSTDENCWGKAKSFLCYKTTDLINFEGPFTLFEKNDNFWSDENYWAPELHKIDGKYYIFASFKAEGVRRCCQALVCDEPFGRYKPLKKPFTPPEWECLDATYYEENGKIYTVFCHEWTQIGDGEICSAELSDDLCEAENIKVLFKASEAGWVRSFDGDKYITDGPYLKRLSNGKLLMIWSSAGEKGYTMGMSVSSGGINGKWKHLDEPLFANDGGHGMFFTFNGKDYVILHTPNGPRQAERPAIFEIEESGEGVKIKKG